MQISEFTPEQLYIVLVHRAKAIMADAGITVDDLQMNNIISHIHVRNAKIRAEYTEQVMAGIKGEAVKMELAEKYGLSFGAINKIVNNER